MRPVPTILPNRLAASFDGDDGKISARGLPKRVSRIGSRLADLLQDRRAFDPKLRNADFSHPGYILTMRKKLRRVTKEQLRREDTYERAMRQALARKPFLKTDGRYLSREEAHDRAGLRRYQRQAISRKM